MKPVKHICLLPLAAACAVILSQPSVRSQELSGEPQTVTLLARKKIDGVDNYTQATFSFKHGVNGDASLKVTRNNWDLLFGNSPGADTFDVTMVVDDCSRIKDLGELKWSDAFDVPVLPAHPEPTREPNVKAVVGHMYVVHTKDRDNDHYALFRVEALEPGKSVTISWKLVASPENEFQGDSEILEAEQALTTASLDGNWEIADRLLAADYIQVDPDGSVYRKDKVVSAIKEWSAFPATIRPRPEVTQSELITRVVGEAVVVVGKVTSKQGYARYEDYVKKRPPMQVVHESRFTHVWIRSENRWQLFSSHRTEIRK